MRPVLFLVQQSSRHILMIKKENFAHLSAQDHGQLSQNSEWLAVFGALAIFFFFISLMLVGAGGWDWFADFLKGTASGWIQAFGSIAAIVGAFSIANRQQREKNAQDEENLRLHKRQHLGICRVVIQRVTSLFDSAEKSSLGDNSISVLRDEADHAMRMLDSLTPFEVPDALLVHRLSLLSQSLRHLLIALKHLQSHRSPSAVEIYTKEFSEYKREGDITMLYCLKLIINISSKDEVDEVIRENSMLKKLGEVVDKEKPFSSKKGKID